MADPLVSSSASQQNSQPVFNQLSPKQPKAVPLVFDFTAQSTYNVDLSVLNSFSTIDFVQSLFIDNSQNASPIFVLCPVTRQTIECPPKSQGYFPFLCTTPVKFTVTTAGAIAGLIIQALNFPVAPAVWPVSSGALAFNGAGALQVSDTILEALVANGGLQVTFPPGQNSVAADTSGTKATYSLWPITLTVGALGTFFQIQGSGTKTIRINFIEVVGWSTAADVALIQANRNSTFAGGVVTGGGYVKHDVLSPNSTAGIVGFANPGAAPTTVAGIRQSMIDLPPTAGPGPGSRILRYDFTNRNDQAIVLRGVNDFFALQLMSIGSGTFATNHLTVNAEWTEE